LEQPSIRPLLRSTSSNRVLRSPSLLHQRRGTSGVWVRSPRDVRPLSAFVMLRFSAAETDPLASPTQIAAELSKYVIGQEKAKKILSVAVFNHYHRITHAQSQSLSAASSSVAGSGGSLGFGTNDLGVNPRRRRSEEPASTSSNGGAAGFASIDGLNVNTSSRATASGRIIELEPDPTKVHDASTWSRSSSSASPTEPVAKRMFNASRMLTRAGKLILRGPNSDHVLRKRCQAIQIIRRSSSSSRSINS
jgi:hypothetical protein